MQQMIQSMQSGGLGGLGGLGNFGGFGNFSTQQQQEPTTEELRTRYATQLQQMQDMGFWDEEANLRALHRSQGNVSAAVEFILSNP